MKKLYMLAMVLLGTTTFILAQTRTWNGPATGGSWTQASNWTGNTVPANGTTVIINGGVSGTITNVPSIDLANLRIEENSNVTFTVTNNRVISVRGNASATPRLFIENGSSLTLSGNNNDDIELELMRTGGGGGGTVRAQIDGTLVLGTSSILDWDNNNTIITVSGSIENVAGNIQSSSSSLQFAAGSFYRHQRNSDNIPTATWNTASTCEVTGVTTVAPGRLYQTFGNFTWDSPNQNGIINLNTDLYDIRGNFTVASTGNNVLRLRSNNGGASSTTVGGDFTLSGGTLVISNQGTHTLAVNGNVSLAGGSLSRTGGTANFVFDRNGAQTYTRTGGTISGSVAFRIDNNSIVDFGTSVLNGSAASFQLDADAKIIVAHADGLYSGTTGSGAIQVGGSRSYSSGAIYEFRGARTGTFSTWGNDVQGLVINNTSGETVLERAFDVTSSLELINGYATNDNSTLITVGTTGSISSSNGGYVNGILAKSHSSNTAVIFYVGSPDAGGLRPVTLGNLTGNNTNTFTARFIRNTPSSITNGTVLGPGVSRVSACEYWTLSRSGSGSRTGTVAIGWEPASDCSSTSAYVTNLLTLRVARHDGNRWVNEGGNLISGASLASGEVRTSNRVSSYTAFALASSSITDNPLPVLFADVRAYLKNNGVQIEWSNLTERDVIDYQVERSVNGVDFSSINLQLPKSNRDDKASYDYFDASSQSSTNFYRIRVLETNGKPVYSKILRVEISSNKNVGFSLYPNPVTGKQFTVSLSGLDHGRYTLQVFTTAGQRVYNTTINNVGSGVTQMVELPSSIQTGVYTTVISGDNYRESRQVVVK